MSSLDTFLRRTFISSVIIILFSALAYADATGFLGVPPAWWLLPVLILLGVGGVNELNNMFQMQDSVLPVWTLRLGVITTFLAVAFGTQNFDMDIHHVPPVAALGWAFVALTVSAGCLVALEVIDFKPAGRSLERLSAGLFILTYLGVPMAFMVSLRLIYFDTLAGEQHPSNQLGMLPLVSMIAVVKAGDICAYAAGSVFGRNKLSPLLSPGKTWEGAGASLAGSSATAWFIFHGLGMEIPYQPLGGWLVFGLTVGLAGMLGDLAESLIKRETGLKDSGKTLAGLGGVLDLMDSLLFATPVAWSLWVAGMNAG